VYRKDSAGETVRQPALQITTLGCRCMACRHSWSPELHLHLPRPQIALGPPPKRDDGPATPNSACALHEQLNP
jgi:hypothetical protein